MEVAEPFNNFLGRFLGISMPILIQWIIIALVFLIVINLTKSLKKVPSSKQSAVEIFVEAISNLVKENMGEGCSAFVPYIGTLVIFILLMNLIGLLGIEPPTQDFSVVVAIALVTFVVVQVYAIKKQGIKGYFLGYVRPVGFLLPINIMERIILPVSLSLRLFGNITAAVVIMDYVYKFLSKSPLGIAQLGIPVPLHFYFDVFDGIIQMIIFVMLTMINIKIIAEHE